MWARTRLTSFLVPSEVVVPPKPVPTGPEAPRESDSQRVRTARLIAIVTGLLGLLLALATPFLPVKQEAASIDWPQGGTVNSVSSPLISYSPTSLDISIPCSTLGQLGGSGGTLLSTMPNGAPDRNARGLTVRTTADRLEALTRDSVLISTPLDQLSGCTAITITTNSEQTVAAVTGIDGVGTTLTGDYRPQVVGIFTDLQGAAPAGLSAHMDVDSRFSSSPTLLKLFAMIVAALSTIVSLYALHRIDGVDGRRAAVPAYAMVEVHRHRRPGYRHAGAVACVRRQHFRRRLPARHGPSLGALRVHGQLLPLVRSPRSAVRLVLRRAGAVREGQHREHVDAPARVDHAAFCAGWSSAAR